MMSSAVAFSLAGRPGMALKPMSLMPTSSSTQRAPGRDSTSRSNRARPLDPAPSRSTRLPEMPMLITARGGRLRCAASRRARIDGQGVSASGVVENPSVMESPNAMMAAALGAASTSMPSSHR